MAFGSAFSALSRLARCNPAERLGSQTLGALHCGWGGSACFAAGSTSGAYHKGVAGREPSLPWLGRQADVVMGSNIAAPKSMTGMCGR